MVRVALPNKGRLSEKAVELFSQAGLPPQHGSSRALMAPLGDEFQAVFVRAADVPEFLADGAAEFGVTGADLVAESGRDVTELLDLEFGACRVAVAVRDDSDLHRPSQLPSGSRIATSFPTIARKYFADLGIDIEIAPVSGAVEIAPHLGVADVIVDLVSTGSTLRVNGLREIGTIMTSSARLIAGPGVLEDATVARKSEELVMALESVLRAREKRYLMANVPRNRLDEVKQILPGLTGPTIIDVLNGGGWVAAHAVVESSTVYRTIADLKALGATGILVTPIERLMP